jgi:hypothetical protein
MAALPDTIPYGAGNLAILPPDGSSSVRRYRDDSPTTAPAFITTSGKTLPKTAARPFDVRVLTLRSTIKVASVVPDFAYVEVPLSLSLNMPIALADDAAYQTAVKTVLRQVVAYFTGGLSAGEITSIDAVIADNVGAQLVLGRL